MDDDTGRRSELQHSLAHVQERIEAACAAAHRDPREVTLIAVTKFFPVADARRLVELGAVDLGESRDQEAAPKASELPQARWHFVGRLQKNKARSVAAYAAVVHSVDRAELADALAAGVKRAERGPLPVFLQVNLDQNAADDPDGASRRGGLPPAGVDELADHIGGLPELELLGLMAVAPFGADPDPAFARLADASERLREGHPGARWLSAGMSGDLEQAIAHGATHVRVGTALLGPRPPNVG